MKKYIGTKMVSAEPAYLIDGAIYPIGGEVPKVMNRKDGYKVVYEDGYESWSPKDVFEKAYRVAETFVDRLAIEHYDLHEKMDKLDAFLKSEKFRDIVEDDTEAFVLQYQHKLMQQYLFVLQHRMEKAGDNMGRPVVTKQMPFGMAIEAMKAGLLVTRNSWKDDKVIIKQIPAHIEADIVPRMTSLPSTAKKAILTGSGHIDYTSQCLIYDMTTGKADSWTPTIDDVFANDWDIAVPKENLQEM